MAEEREAAVAVVGAGPAGIAAACRAAEAGASVLVLDEGLAAGGQIWRGAAASGQPTVARRWLDRLGRSGARIVPGTTVVDVTAGFVLTAERQGQPLRVHAERIVLATGARERFLPFPGWTLPNVMGVGAGQALLKSGASFHGKNVVIAGSGPLLLPVAALMQRNGAQVRMVAEQAALSSVASFAVGLWRHPAKVIEAIGYRAAFLGVSYRLGVWVVAATGEGCVHEAVLTDGRGTWREPCDVLCCAYGLVPNVELAQLLGCEVAEGKVRVDYDQQTSVARVYCAGEPTGVGGADLALVEGEIAGLAAVGRAADAAALRRSRDRRRPFVAALETAFRPRDELRHLAQDDTIVCRCEDVAFKSLDRRWSSRQAKLYTRAGMGPCQGRVCGPALTTLFGWEADSVRSPLKPATVTSLLDT